jgi:hypothetical protein
MGGIGKTTLATVLYNKFQPFYQASCFLMNVTSRCTTDLQRLMLKELCGQEMEVNDIAIGLMPHSDWFSLAM